MSMFYNILKFKILNIILISTSLFASDQMSLRQLIRENKYEKAKDSLDSISNINEQNNLRETYLHTAVTTGIQTGDAKILILLLQQPGIDTSLSNLVGKTPKMCAQLHEQTNLIQAFELHEKKQKEMQNPVASFSTDGNKQPLLEQHMKPTWWSCTSWFCSKYQ